MHNALRFKFERHRVIAVINNAEVKVELITLSRQNKLNFHAMTNGDVIFLRFKQNKGIYKLAKLPNDLLQYLRE